MKTIRFERDGAIGRIVLANLPRNLISEDFSRDLRDAVHEASEADIRVLIVRSEGSDFSFGGDVRDWPGKDKNWFRTFVAGVNVSFRAIDALRIPCVAAVRGAAWGGAFELALSCDFVVAAENAQFRCIEVTTGMLPIAGGLQRLAERAGRAWAARWSMLGEPISGKEAGLHGIATYVVPDAEVEATAAKLAATLAQGPTMSYAATRALLKAWSSGGVAGADAILLDVTMDLYTTEDATRGFASTAKAFKAGVEPPDLIFNGR